MTKKYILTIFIDDKIGLSLNESGDQLNEQDVRLIIAVMEQLKAGYIVYLNSTQKIIENTKKEKKAD